MIRRSVPVCGHYQLANSYNQSPFRRAGGVLSAARLPTLFATSHFGALVLVCLGLRYAAGWHHAPDVDSNERAGGVVEDGGEGVPPTAVSGAPRLRRAMSISRARRSQTTGSTDPGGPDHQPGRASSQSIAARAQRARFALIQRAQPNTRPPRLATPSCGGGALAHIANTSRQSFGNSAKGIERVGERGRASRRRADRCWRRPSSGRFVRTVRGTRGC